MDCKSSGILGACLIIATLILALVPKPYVSGAASVFPPVGRFQMAGIPGHAYVVDTATGQVWEDFATAGSGSNDAEFKRPKLK